jgi:hypothetical protein
VTEQSGAHGNRGGQAEGARGRFDLIGSDWCFRCDKAERELGWKMTPFAQGMAETWRDYQGSSTRAPVVTA